MQGVNLPPQEQELHVLLTKSARHPSDKHFLGVADGASEIIIHHHRSIQQPVMYE